MSGESKMKQDLGREPKNHMTAHKLPLTVIRCKDLWLVQFMIKITKYIKNRSYIYITTV